MKNLFYIFVAAILSIFIMGASGCGESKTENAIEDVGEKIEDTATEAKDKMEDGAEKAKEALSPE